MSAGTSSNRGNPTTPNPSLVADTAPEVPLGGITPFTTIDFPGRLAAVLYTQGCPWRCRYCHNSHLWAPAPPSEGDTPFRKALRFLEKRRGFLDGVVFSGGEPTLHRDLAAAMRAVKAIGFEVGLHTTGMFPGRLEEALPECDWVGMDVKAPSSGYERVTGTKESGCGAWQSVDLVLKSGVAHEFRTTLHSALLSEKDVLDIALELRRRGAARYVLQVFRPDGCSDVALNADKRPAVPSDRLRMTLEGMFPSFDVRLP